jgi:cytochrome c oxidase cbb3-type subunit 3
MTGRTGFFFTAILLISTGLLSIAQQSNQHPANPHPDAKTQEAATGGVQPHDSHAGSPAVLAQGKAEFLARCGFCHGPDATGASAPDLTRSLLVRQDVNGNLIGPVILNGRPEKGMPAFQLSDAQIAAIVAFLHARAKEELFSFGMPKNYSFHAGDAKTGKAFFFGKGHCSSCHSPEGDLKGIASKYPPLTLMALIAYPDGTADRTATVTTASGNTISGQLVHLDEFTVSIRDAAGWIHTWDRGAVKMTVHDPLAEHRRLLMNYTDAELHDLFAYLETLK